VRLINARIQNFKLLESLEIEFSVDPDKPLTLIRAANGSGKTSLLYALRWSFYGMEGLPPQAADRRLSASFSTPGVPVEIQARIEFEHYDDVSRTRSRFRLIRSVTETPGLEDTVDRGPEILRLLRITSSGEEEMDGAQGIISRIIPSRLASIFFTNGDDVQQFISGHIESPRRQNAVHEAIRMLLGMDQLEIADRDLDKVLGSLKREMAGSGGGDLEAIIDELEKANDALDESTSRHKLESDRLARIDSAIEEDEKELTGLRGIGDIDEINRRIDALERDIKTLKGQEQSSLDGMKALLRSEATSWTLMAPELSSGLRLMRGLADRNVIPGTSLEVLRDRVELETCICGESLSEGSKALERVLELFQEQKEIEPVRAKQTQTWHLARQSHEAFLAEVDRGGSLQNQRNSTLSAYTDAVHGRQGKESDLEAEKARRSMIKEERVQELVRRIATARVKLSECNRALGEALRDISTQQTTVNQFNEEFKKAEARSKISAELSARRDAVEDLREVTRQTLTILKTDHVARVSEHMNRLFLDIVGSDPELDASVFKGVKIESDFDIIVQAGGGRTLDPDFELNGASQRALTLAFIWSLMAVSGKEAPRIIDTPLGMTSGGVKRRIVEMVSTPSESHADFQVVLLMTRSEVRDVEDLLDEWAGKSITMSCSKDYPKDLVSDWGVEHPVVRACSCDHRESCDTCRRHYDQTRGIAQRKA
jgi:DNA sulfur modification protein DndD